MPKVIKVVGSKSKASMDYFLDNGKVYPYLYIPHSMGEKIRMIEGGYFPPFPYDLSNEEQLEEHMGVLNAEDAEVLYEA